MTPKVSLWAPKRRSNKVIVFICLGYWDHRCPRKVPRIPKCPQKVHFGAILDKFGSPPGSLGVKMMPKVEQNEV